MTVEKRHPLLKRGLRTSSTAPTTGSILVYDASSGKWVPTTKPTITGAKAGNAALTSLLSALAAMGIITDSTT